MTALIIIGIALLFVSLIYFGHYLWTFAKREYDYNIFNLGVIIRGLLSLGCLFMGINSLDSTDGSDYVWFIAASILWLLTFIITLTRTNFLIAFFSIFYQLVAVLFIKTAIEKVLQVINKFIPSR